MISIKNIDKNITETQQETSTRVVPRKKKLGGRVTGILVIAVIILTILYIQQKREVTRLTDPVAQAEYAQKQAEKVITELKKTVVVTEDEELKLLGVISDADALKKDQAFYANVEKGDYVFLFSKSSRALIWRPGANKIVNFGVADTAQAQQNVQQPTAPAQSKTNATTSDEE